MMVMSPDEQEARSRRYCNDVIMLLPLSSGRVAVFNSARDLCKILDPAEEWWASEELTYSSICRAWYPPAASAVKPNPTLEELFK